MAAGNVEFEKPLATLESDATVRTAKVPGMASLLNQGPSVVFISVLPACPTADVQTDGTISLPVNIPVPLPRELRDFFHRTASGAAKTLVLTDLR